MEGGPLSRLFADGWLLLQALTHRSAGSPNNERMEFLGDALVNAIIADALFALHPRADEGVLTRARAALVCEASLAEIARELQIGDQLRLGPGELKSGGHRRDSILADALEAVIAAIFLDSNFDNCRRVVRGWFESRLSEGLPKQQKDAKTRLQEWLQSRAAALPIYLVTATHGEAHAQAFEVSCSINDPPMTTVGVGSSRRQAEQASAAALLQALEGR